MVIKAIVKFISEQIVFHMSKYMSQTKEENGLEELTMYCLKGYRIVLVYGNQGEPPNMTRG